MTLTSVSVVNQALVQIGSQSQISSFLDGSVEAIAANTIYQNTINDVLRQFSWDFARKVNLLIASGVNPPLGWSSEFTYPADGIEIRQIVPTTAPTSISLNPQPIRWAVSSNTLDDKVIWTTIPPTTSVTCVYTYQAPEAIWDSIFTQAAISAVAEALAMAIAGRPDFAGKKLEEAGGQIQLGESRYS